MTTTEQPSATPSPAPRKRRKWWKILLGVMIVLFIIVLLTPALLSTGPGKNFLLDQVNKRVAGTVTADELSIGWFSGASVRGLVVKDPDGKEVINVPSADTGLTLLSAVGQSFQGLNLVLRGKEATIAINSDGTTNLARAFASPAKGAAPVAGPQAAAGTASKSSSVPSIHADVDVQFENVVCTSPNSPTLTIQNIVADGVLDTGGGETDLKVTAEAKSGNGNPAALSATMKGRFFENGTLKPLGALAGMADINVQTLDLATIAPLLSAAGIKLQLAGTAACDFKLDQNAGKQTATGTVTIHQFAATGDLLKGDTFKRDLITVTLDAALNGDNVDLHSLKLTTDAISAEVAGSLKTSEGVNGQLPPLSVQAAADVTALKQQLPHLLGTAPDTQATVALTGAPDLAKNTFEITEDSTIAEKDPQTGLGNSIVLAKGSVLSWGNAANDVHITANVNWPRVQAILAKQLPDGTTMQGTQTINLHVAGSMANAPGLGAFKGFTIDPTSIGWDQMTIRGFTLGKSAIGLRMENGMLTIAPTDIPANGGTIHLGGRVDFTQNPPVYILDKQAEPTHLVKDVQLNQKIATGSLNFLPLAWGGGNKSDGSVGAVTGQLDVDLDETSIPLDSDTFKKKGKTSGTISILKLNTNAPLFSQIFGAIGGLAKLTHIDLSGVHGGEIRNGKFALNEGKVSYQNLTMGANEFNMTFSGWVGLDTSLSMQVAVTTGKLQIPIPIGLGGTTSKPKLTFSDRGIGGKIGQGIGNTVQDVAGEIGNLFGKKKKSQ